MKGHAGRLILWHSCASPVSTHDPMIKSHIPRHSLHLRSKISGHSLHDLDTVSTRAHHNQYLNSQQEYSGRSKTSSVKLHGSFPDKGTPL